MITFLRKFIECLCALTCLVFCTGYLFMTLWVFTGMKSQFVDTRGFMLSFGYAATWPVWLAPTMSHDYRDLQNE